MPPQYQGSGHILSIRTNLRLRRLAGTAEEEKSLEYAEGLRWKAGFLSIQFHVDEIPIARCAVLKSLYILLLVCKSAFNLILRVLDEQVACYLAILTRKWCDVCCLPSKPTSGGSVSE